MTAVDSHLLLRAMIDEFVRCGAEHAVACPGSRNTPIVLRLAADERLTTWSQIDERSAGFFGLGIAKSTARPVILTCTSGTAAANFLPAIVEAQQARVPLIVLTADRPPELQQIGAGQTIDQTKLYGDNVKWFFELGVPEATPERLRWARALACRAYWTATHETPGPVHLNLPLREPLILDAPLPAEEPGGGGRAGGEPWVTEPAPPTVLPGVIGSDGSPGKMVWVAGDLGPDPELGARVARAAAQMHVPLLADPLSNARSGASAIAHFDLILRDPATRETLAPEWVVRFGDLPTSKPLRAWLDQLDPVQHLHFTRDTDWIDPGSRVSRRIVGPFEQTLQFGTRPAETANTEYLHQWTTADRAVAHAISAPLAPAGLSEPAVATALGQFLPPRATLFVAASMPIRDVEEFFPALNEPPRVMANRGANGIDGTLATAFGVAAANARAAEETGADPDPVVLLVGDVTVAHDIGSLISASRNGLKLTIVLLNNDGGGIFHFLAVANEGDAFEQYVATAPGLDFAKAAELYGLGYARARDFDEFTAVLFAALASPRSELIEVRTDRVANRALHADVESAALAALRSL